MKLATYISGGIIGRQLGYESLMGIHPASIYGLTHDSITYPQKSRNYFHLPFHEFYWRTLGQLNTNYKIRRDMVEVNKEYKKAIKNHNLEMSVKTLAEHYLFFSFHLKRVRIKDRENQVRGHILIHDYVKIFKSGIDPVKAAGLYAYGCEPEDMHIYLEMPLIWVQRIHKA
jgi:hypothetical protein